MLYKKGLKEDELCANLDKMPTRNKLFYSAKIFCKTQKTNLKKTLILAFVLSTGNICLAQDNSVYLKDGKIVVETKQGLKKALDYEESSRYSSYNLKKWGVKEKLDPVAEALKVFKRKKETFYNKKIYIFEKISGKEQIVIEYIVDKSNDKVIFSPNEDFMFYIGLSDTGESIVYGINLFSEQKFKVDSGNNLAIANCWSNKSYIIIKDNVSEDDIIYYIYNLKGKRLGVLSKSMIVGDLDDYICY